MDLYGSAPMLKRQSNASARSISQLKALWIFRGSARNARYSSRLPKYSQRNKYHAHLFKAQPRAL